MGRLRHLAGVASILIGECQSFFVPFPAASYGYIGSRVGAPPPSRQPARFEKFHQRACHSCRSPPPCPAAANKATSRSVVPLAGEKKLQALASASEIHQGNHSSTDNVEAPAPFTPTLLWWTTNRAEEDASLNLVANAGFIAGVLLFAIVMVFTVDTEVSRGWTAAEFFLRVPVDNWLAYTEVLQDNPVLVKACTSGTVYALGDWTAQTFEGVALSDIKRGRVLRSALAGLLLHGPLSHVWYGLCESWFDALQWNGYWWVTAPKVFIDQLLWGPFWNAVYICFLGALKKDSPDAVKKAVVSTAIPLVLAGIRLWPLAHVVTYGLIPTENRLLWVDFVEIIWVTILSKQAAQQARSADTEEAT